ncbi:MAG: molybdenum cofactor biosynthesis protein MoaE [Thaumarchaeota archaeon]|nr:molybdenum cofactor biosynthesis protein MoaE [Nitrososphaerota archaeon]
MKVILANAEVELKRLNAKAATLEEAGAVVLFLGTVRNNSEAGRVERIEYEAYAPMAEKRLAEAEREVRRRWPRTTGVKIVHRVGSLTIGEVSVAVAVSSPHRAEAFEACRHAIEMIKRDVPIWKREKLSDGSEVWVEGVPFGSRGKKTRGAGKNPRPR